MAITLKEKIELEVATEENPDGITYRLFRCPFCNYAIVYRFDNVHKCKKCDLNVVDMLRLRVQPRYRAAYHFGIVNNADTWNWKKGYR